MLMNVTFRLIALEDAEQLQANCMPGATVEGIRRWIPEDLRAHEAGEKVPLVAPAAMVMLLRVG